MRKILKQIEKHAIKNGVPILHKKSRRLLVKLVKPFCNRNILEIGTGTGYSGILMLANSKKSTLITIDKSPDRFNIANQNFKVAGLIDRVNMQNIDAIEFLEACTQKFDIIFFDAAMHKYKEMFLLAKKMLMDNGIMIFDNVLKLEKTNKTNETKILEKVGEFLGLVKNDSDFTIKVYDIGEGVCVLNKQADNCQSH